MTGLNRWAKAIVWLVGAVASGCGASDLAGAAGPDVDVPVTCENFCNIMWRHCHGEWRMYTTLSECRSACATWPDQPTGLSGRGNSLQCRFLYAALAIHAQDEAGYCLNANAAGGQMCRD